MVFIAGLLCILALIWILIRTRRPAAKHRAKLAEDAFDGAMARNLFEKAPIGYMEIDRNGIVRRVNHLECKLRARDRSAMLGVHCAELIPKIERERYREQIQRKIEGHTALVPYQREYRHKGGRKTAVEVHEQLLTDQTGAVAGMRMASIDITERTNSEDAAYKNASELRALFQAFPDLFLRLDKSENVLDAKGGQRSDAFLSADRRGSAGSRGSGTSPQQQRHGDGGVRH